MVIAELLRKKGEYRSFKYNMLSFAIFNTWICGFLNTFTIMSTESEMRLDVCSVCHPFFTGQKKNVTRGSRMPKIWF